MPKYKVAHIHEQGVDMIVIPLERQFGLKSQSDQNETCAELQAKANSAGLKGNVVLVWDSGSGRMGFIAPPQWHAFFKSCSLQWVAANINQEIYW